MTTFFIRDFGVYHRPANLYRQARLLRAVPELLQAVAVRINALALFQQFLEPGHGLDLGALAHVGELARD